MQLFRINVAIISIKLFFADYNKFKIGCFIQKSGGVSAEPVINSQHLLFDIIGAGANVTWNYDTKDQNYTTVMIEQCVSKPECVHHNVTGNNSLVVPLADGELFYLVIYHDGLESYRSEPFSRVPQPTGKSDIV